MLQLIVLLYILVSGEFLRENWCARAMWVIWLSLVFID